MGAHTRRARNVALVAVFALGLAACGDPSKQETLKKAEGVSTRADLEAALGRPDDLSKMGPIERWTYDASDGSVVFLITGDEVALQMTGGRSR